MVKTIVSTLIVALLLTGSAIYENYFVNKQFSEFNQPLTQLIEKVDDKTAVEDDVYTVQTFWLEKKKFLHIFIPHNEIKEIDLWLAESVKLVRDEKWEDARSKVEVLLELSEQIPKTFTLAIENIM